MSRARVAVLQVISDQMSVTDSAARYGYSRRHLHRLLQRYREGGLDAVEPRSRRPQTNPRRTSPATAERIIQLRGWLSGKGLDAGPVTIAWHLEREGLPVPSTSTIRRILTTAGLIIPEPRKRPRSSWQRFEASQPNETWQSDFTHWRLHDGADVEILNWLDDHSRYLLVCTVFTRVTGDDVVTEFLTLTEKHGIPASTLTDNGSVYTSRFTGGRNAFEYVLTVLGVTQKNGHPYHPQTQGKIERFHQTLKLWLDHHPAPRTIAELQNQLDQFRVQYNEHRPHRAVGRTTPGDAYRATPKAEPATATPTAHHRLRYDHVDKLGKMSIRRAGRMHHLGIGTPHAGKSVLAIADGITITVIDLNTGEIISNHLIEPDKTYWRNQKREPGRWPSSRQ